MPALQRIELSQFERDTLYRMIVGAARYWVVASSLKNGVLPNKFTAWVYDSGPNGIDWGNPPGPDNPDLQPLRHKRIVVTFAIEDR